MVVPRPAERAEIALETHQGMGHFGVQRVQDKLQNNYGWRGMGDAVVEVVKLHISCARVKAGFPKSRKELQPLPCTGAGLQVGSIIFGALGQNLGWQLLGHGMYRLLY